MAVYTTLPWLWLLMPVEHIASGKKILNEFKLKTYTRYTTGFRVEKRIVSLIVRSPYTHMSLPAR